MTPEQTLDWLAEQHKSQCNEDRPVQEWIRSMRSMLPAPVQEPVAFDVTIDGDEAKTLYDQLGDDREDLHPIRIVVGDGHSGYGLYVAQAEYQDEGAVLITSTTPPAAQRQWVDMPELELLGSYEEEQKGRWGDHVRGLLNVQAKLKEKNT